MKRLPESAVNPAQPSDGQALRGTRKRIELKALAKINLGLDVLGKRENGYHDVRMVMQSIYLYDDVRIERTKESGD